MERGRTGAWTDLLTPRVVRGSVAAYLQRPINLARVYYVGCTSDSSTLRQTPGWLDRASWWYNASCAAKTDFPSTGTNNSNNPQRPGNLAALQATTDERQLPGPTDRRQRVVQTGSKGSSSIRCGCEPVAGAPS